MYQLMHMVAREKVDALLKEAEMQRLARSHMESHRRKKMRERDSWLSRWLAEAWARALN